MKNYILGVLVAAFLFVTVHDFVILHFDGDTQTELILKEDGKLDTEQMCKSSQVHHALHDMLVAADVVVLRFCMVAEAPSNENFIYHTFHEYTFFQSLYRPPIA